jgi:plasmid stability protein
MTTRMTVYNIPDRLAAVLREMAVDHHRSLTAELLMILERAAADYEAWTKANSGSRS